MSGHFAHCAVGRHTRWYGFATNVLRLRDAIFRARSFCLPQVIKRLWSTEWRDCLYCCLGQNDSFPSSA